MCTLDGAPGLGQHLVHQDHCLPAGCAQDCERSESSQRAVILRSTAQHGGGHFGSPAAERRLGSGHRNQR